MMGTHQLRRYNVEAMRNPVGKAPSRWKYEYGTDFLDMAIAEARERSKCWAAGEAKYRVVETATGKVEYERGWIKEDLK